MKNKKGQVVIFLLMLAVVVIVLLLALTPAIHETVTLARNASSGDTIGLDCSNSSISDYVSATCIFVDLTTPYFIIILLGVVGGIIGARFIMN